MTHNHVRLYIRLLTHYVYVKCVPGLLVYPRPSLPRDDVTSRPGMSPRYDVSTRSPFS